jgi:hypothetical protein
MVSFGVAVLSVSLAGCVPSVFPLYTDKDVRFDPALVGAWSEPSDPDESWTFTKGSDNSYDLVYREKKGSAPFTVHLVRLGTRQFIDMTPNEDGLKGANLLDIYKGTLIPGHLFAKVSQITPVLKMAFLDPKWIKDYLRDHRSDLAHYLYEDRDVILTAPTRDLQAFMTKHADDKDALGDESKLERKR